MVKKKSSRLFGGIDIGGTKILALVVDENGSVVSTAKRKTKGEAGFKTVCERANQTLREAVEMENIPLTSLEAVGIGVPVPVMADGTTPPAANLPGWKNAPLVKTMEALTGLPCFAENDCNAGVFGEYVWGAGKGAKTLLCFFVGTGLGGGLIFHDQLITGENHLASELGHIIIKEGGRMCSCGRRGCLEAYVAKSGLARRLAWDTIIEGKKSVLTQLVPNGDFAGIKSSVLLEAYRGGDAVVVDALNESAHFLGVGIANYITMLGPDQIVIGGGVFEALGKELLPKVKEAARVHTWPEISYKDTKITLSQLGDFSVGLGTVAYAMHCLDGKNG